VREIGYVGFDAEALRVRANAGQFA